MQIRKVTTREPSTQPLKAAQARLKGLSKRAQALGRLVEHKELTVVGFLRKVILEVQPPDGVESDDSLAVANDALLYLRRRGGTDREWLISLFERHGNLVYMRKTSGKLQRFTVSSEKRSPTRRIDEQALDSELNQKMGANVDLVRKVKVQTLFDKSIQSSTMQASKFAK